MPIDVILPRSEPQMQIAESIDPNDGPKSSPARLSDGARTTWAVETAVTQQHQLQLDFSCGIAGSHGAERGVRCTGNSRSPRSWKPASAIEQEQENVPGRWEEQLPFWPCTEVEDASDVTDSIHAASIHRRAFSTKTFFITFPAKISSDHRPPG